jgi:predicted CoA-binding protein
VGVNPKETTIEGTPCVASLSALEDPADTAVSVITPPSASAPPTPPHSALSGLLMRTMPMTEVTVGVLEEAARLGIKKLWLQPGRYVGTARPSPNNTTPQLS